MDIDAFLGGLGGQAESADGVPSVSILMYLLLVQRDDARGAVTPVDGDEFGCRDGIDAQVGTEGLDMCILSDLCKLAGLDAVLVRC